MAWQIHEGNVITQQDEIFTNKFYTIFDATFTGNTTQPRVSYPRLHIAQPTIPDETGVLKFRYAVRMSAEMHLTFHLYPDHTMGAMKAFWQRQVVPLPETKKRWFPIFPMKFITFHIVRECYGPTVANKHICSCLFLFSSYPRSGY
jgi:hypothetical protein